jgi:hypothetical protein
MHSRDSFAHRLMWVIWPAFLVAGAAEAIFFTVFDPFDLHFFGATLDWSRGAIYTMGFFGFWGLGIASSALTVFLERSPWEADRGPVEPGDRTSGGAKREAPDPCGATDEPPSR